MSFNIVYNLKTIQTVNISFKLAFADTFMK